MKKNKVCENYKPWGDGSDGVCYGSHLGCTKTDCPMKRQIQVAISGVGSILSVYASSVEEALKDVLKRGSLENNLITIYFQGRAYHFTGKGVPVKFVGLLAYLPDGTEYKYQ